MMSLTFQSSLNKRSQTLKSSGKFLKIQVQKHWQDTLVSPELHLVRKLPGDPAADPICQCPGKSRQTTQENPKWWWFLKLEGFLNLGKEWSLQ